MDRSSPPERSWLGRLQPVDWLLASYNLVVLLVLLARAPELRDWPWLALAHLLIFALVLLVRTPGNWARGFASKAVRGCAKKIWLGPAGLRSGRKSLGR